MKAFIFLLFISISLGSELPPDEVLAQKNGLRQWSIFADELSSSPTNAEMEKLGEGLRKTNRPSIYSIDDTKEVAEKLKATARSIPGHAIYFKEKIEGMRAEALVNHNLSREALQEKRETSSRSNTPLVEEGDYTSYAEQSLITLRYLPSAETVAVLGYYLNDPEGRDPKKEGFGQKLGSSDSFRSSTNSELAVAALGHLGIQHPPARTQKNPLDPEYYTPEEIDAWKDWWNEIAAGKRTYRFIGSDVEYGPNGPVSKDKLERIQQNRQRDAERAIGNSKPGGMKAAASVVALSRPLPLAGILATAILAVSTGWYFLKRRKAA